MSPTSRRIATLQARAPVAVGLLVGLLMVGIGLPAVIDEAPTTATAVGPGAAPDSAGGPRDTDPAPAVGADDPTGSGVDPASGVSDTPGEASQTPQRRDPGREDALGAQQASESDGRGASDVGVDEDTIRLGFFLLDITGGDRVGFAVGISVEQQTAAVQAYVDEINQRGGIHGRVVEAHVAAVNLLDADDGRRACLALTQDAKVFAATGRLHRTDAECVATEHRTFLLNNVESAPDGMFTASNGLLTNTYSRASRLMKNWVYELDRIRYLEGRRIGIVTDEKEDPRAESATMLKGELERSGHEVVRIARLSGDLQTASSQIPIEVSQMRSAGAEAIFLMANPLPDTQFVQQAESQGWHPRYAVSDWAAHAGDTSNSNMPRSYEGTLALTAAPVGRGTTVQPGWDEPEPAKECRDTYEHHSGRELAERGTNEYSLTMVYCDSIRILEQVLLAAGINPTRETTRSAVTRVGDIAPLAARMGGSFGPGKPDLDDYLRFQAWSYDCRCFEPVDQFRRARF